MKEIKNWCFVVTDNGGEEKMITYGNGENDLLMYAFKMVKLKYPVCRIATLEDIERFCGDVPIRDISEIRSNI